jgi:hypothetical protein
LKDDRRRRDIYRREREKRREKRREEKRGRDVFELIFPS